MTPPTVVAVATEAVATSRPAASAAPPAAAPVAILASLTPAPALGVAPRQDGDSALMLARMRLAESRFSQVTGYLASDPAAAPLWNDVQAQLTADRLRQRIAPRSGGQFEFASPRWELQRDNASIEVDYRCRACGIREGRLAVKMVWREGLWLVRDIDLEPSA